MKHTIMRWIDKYLEAMGAILESCEWFPNARQMNRTVSGAKLPDEIRLPAKEERYVSNCSFNG